MRYWRTRLDQFDRDLKQEPGRIRAFYEVQAKRVEPGWSRVPVARDELSGTVPPAECRVEPVDDTGSASF